MAKQAADLPLPALTLDPAAARPLHRQIYFGIRAAILAGRMKAGERLPASRRLAQALGVSRNTVLAAFEQLRAEGYIEGRIGAGSFVPRHLPDEAPLVGPGGPRRDPGRLARLAPAGRQPSARAQALARGAEPGPAARAFLPGLPELELFPFQDWARLLARRWRRPRRDFLVGAGAGGDPALRQAIAGYLASARAVVCEPGQVIITAGAQQALDLTARVLIDPGDLAWVEEPGYRPLSAVLTAAGAVLRPVPVDGEGLALPRGPDQPPPRLIAVAPSHQYPLGVTMSLPRRLALLDFARQAGSFILEDDYDSEFRYAGRPLAALQGLDDDRRVIYLGTFSKVMFPGLRLGYLVAPPDLVDSFLALRALIDAHPSSIAQAALADFIEDGHLAGHIRRMRQLYGERQALLIDFLQARLAGALQLAPAEAGMHLVADLAAGLDDQRLSQQARAAGVEAPALSGYFQGRPERTGLLLGYAGVGIAEMRRASEILARVVTSYRSAPSASPAA